MNALHSCDSPEWYTPTPFVEVARVVLGTIDLDPASHPEANERIKATRIFTEQENGLLQVWTGNIFINPPGGKGLIAQFWKKFIESGCTGVWIGYSLEQLQTLQSCEGYPSPIDFPICLPNRRIVFVENEAKKAERIAKLLAEGKSPNKKSQPTHANYVTYIGENPALFAKAFGQFGAVRI